METLKIIIIGITQGITELLPISSSGHILLLSQAFNITTNSLFLTTFHIGTTLAILLFFREEIFKNLFTKSKLLFLLKIAVASIPAAFAGALFDDFISEKLRAIPFTAISLLIWGLVMILMERRYREIKETNVEDISWRNALSMGIAQTLALIPGTSRSGITTIAGILSGLNKYSAIKFSLILGIPVLLGGSIWEIGKELLRDNPAKFTINNTDIVVMTLTILIPFIFGYLSLLFLKRFKQSHWLTIFGVYRVILGIVLLITVLV